MATNTSDIVLTNEAVAYALMQLQACFPNKVSRVFRIDYFHEEKNTWLRHEIPFEIIDGLHSGLSDYLLKLFDDANKLAGSDKAKTINAVAAYLSGQYRDLQVPVEALVDYRYVSKVYSLRSAPNNRGFVVDGNFFSIMRFTSGGIPQVSLSNFPERVVKAEQLDAIYREGSKRVLLLEALGYNGYQILEAIEENKSIPEVASNTNDLGDITFE